MFEANAMANGVVVHWAKDAAEHNRTILQTCHELASFQLVELHLIPRQPGLLGGTAASPHAGSTPPSTISAVPQ
jgi:hypothetical protein